MFNLGTSLTFNELWFAFLTLVPGSSHSGGYSRGYEERTYGQGGDAGD